MQKIYKPLTKKEEALLKKVLFRFGYNKYQKIQRNVLGFNNAIYEIEIGGKEYILRQARNTTPEWHIHLELEVLQYLEKKGFGLTPKVIPASNGKLFIKYKGWYFTLQTRLPGKVVASWEDVSSFSLRQLLEFAKASAHFSKAIKGFTFYRKVPKESLYTKTRTALGVYKKLVKKLPHTAEAKSVKEREKFITAFGVQAFKDLEAIQYDKLPKQLVHFDFQPGNVHFLNNKVCGIFDFDWALFDTRLSDVVAMIAQATYYFGGKKDGVYRKDRIWAALGAYRKAYGKSEFPLSKEDSLIQIGLKAYIWFQFVFTLEEYLQHLRSKRHATGLVHFTRLITENNYEQLFN